MILANGQLDDVLTEIASGRDVGTLFVGQGNTIPAWKKWIGFAAQSEGRLMLDDGACQAIAAEGKSLLAVGIREVSGRFDQGASVELCNMEGRLIARGLANYSSTELAQIAGRKSTDIRGILGHVPYSEVIHRDNLQLVSR